MGLSAPKQRTKLSHDPNNTKWTNDSESFGLKIMASQGWKPGEYLGVKNAPHAEFHTAANSSHIRVIIKDDNLGLGAKIGSGVGHGECTGLDAFKDLLGRLNGKGNEELEKEQRSREDLKRAIYTERKWGTIRFVQGGFLIGDKIQRLIDDEVERVRMLAIGDATSSNDSSDSSDSSDEAPEPVLEKSKKSKKRKLEEVEETPKMVAVKVKKSKKQRRSEATSKEVSEVAAGLEDVKVSKKSKKNRQPEADIEDSEDATEAKKRKKERKEKRDRKEKSKSRNEEKSTKGSEKKSKRDRRKTDLNNDPGSSESIPTTKENTPSTPLEPQSSGRSTPIMLQGRHSVRARNIAQKRLASMDVAALNQIFMIKS